MSGTKYWKGRKFKVESKVNISNQKANTGLGLYEVYAPLEMRYGRRFDSFHFYTIRTRNGLGVTLAMKQEKWDENIKNSKIEALQEGSGQGEKTERPQCPPCCGGLLTVEN